VTGGAAVTVAVDIGGTFTDFCAVVDEGGRQRLVWTKEPSTRADPIRAVLAGTRRLLRELDQPPTAVVRFLHGTTVATNAVLERTGARLGVLMTEGFEDTLELGRQDRRDMYRLDPEPETPAFLAPGRRRRGVVERVAADGQVVVPLDERRLVAAVDELVGREGCEALAVCYLFAFVNPVHERRTRQLVAARYPGLAVSLSHEVDPVFREYERACLTAFDAYLRPVMGRYLAALQAELSAIGICCPVLTMQSRGGLASTVRAAERPVSTLLSGPAAGVAGATRVAARAGVGDCITLDMGGTSADIALVTAGKPVTTTAGRIERYPLRMPMVDVNTIGAGGGSVAWLDPAGGLHVGPRSAGAEPGPACYGRGGAEPTVTDASLVLGYLDPARFAGGLHLDADAAWRALERLAAPLGLSVPETAHGIHRIVNARMADETRLVSIRRGWDPRRFTLVLFGGGGPVSGWAVAEELGITRLVVPFAPGALSAFGLLVARVEADGAVTVKVAAERADPARLEEAYGPLEAAGRARLARDGFAPGEIAGQRSADLRYVGQSYELEVPLPATVDGPALAAAVAAFHEAHQRVYGHAQPQAPVEFVNLRTLHAAALPPVDEAVAAGAGRPGPAARRRCYFPQANGFVETAVLDRAALARGQVLAGPAVIHQPDATTVVPPGYACRVDALGNLVLQRTDPA
jgi:N-methylhydantoinase A